MPIRLVDGDAAWWADKLAACREEFVPHYFMLVPLALANGSFEYNVSDITRRVYGKTMPSMTPDQVEAILVQFQRVKLLFIWRTEDGKLWGYWTKIERRLPPVSWVRRGEYRLGAPVPVAGLAEFLGKAAEEVRAELEGTAAVLGRRDQVRRPHVPRDAPGTAGNGAKGVPGRVEVRYRRGIGRDGGRGGSGLPAVSSSSPTAPPPKPQGGQGAPRKNGGSADLFEKRNQQGIFEPTGQSRIACSYALFEEEYREATGRPPGGSPKKRELYRELCEEFGEKAVLEAVRSWAAQRGGPAELRGNKSAVWSFLEEGQCRAEIVGGRGEGERGKRGPTDAAQFVFPGQGRGS